MAQSMKRTFLYSLTGFDVQRFLTGFDAYGRSGQSLREAWNDTDPRAYMAGLTVPDFPNFFILYGPNSQPGHGGSVVVIMEMLMHYVTQAIQTMLEKQIGALECRRDVLDRYVAEVDAAHEKMVWTHPGNVHVLPKRDGSCGGDLPLPKRGPLQGHSTLRPR